MKDQVLAILQETRPESDFVNSQNFITESLLESFDMVMLIGELEERFDVAIDGTDIVPDNFVTIEAIIRLIESSR